MKLAVMQPYFMPYIGYFQLIHAVDKFVVYDDVAFKKRGWINRNRILINGEPFLFTLQALDASQFNLINQVKVGDNRGKLQKTFIRAYGKAPYFEEVNGLLAKILQCPENNMARFVANSLTLTCEYLGITTKMVMSSDIEKDTTLKADDKIIAICNALHANTYINAIGGTELYSKSKFKEHGIELKFLKTLDIQYSQFDNPFIPWLSIIDVMMFNSRDAIRHMLNMYELI